MAAFPEGAVGESEAKKQGEGKKGGIQKKYRLIKKEGKTPLARLGRIEAQEGIDR